MAVIADERDRAIEAATALQEPVSSNPYRLPELRHCDREGYPFAVPVYLPPDVSRFQLTREESR